MVDEIARTKYRGDSHRAWKDGGEIEQELWDAILRSPIHVIGAMRTKRDYVRSTEDGKTKIRAAGTKTIQREEFDFEFDLVGRFDVPTVLTVMKTRVDTLPPETVIDKPGAAFAATLKAWLDTGAENAAIERPTAADKKILVALKRRLSAAKPETDWDAKIEEAAHKKFTAGLDALSRSQFFELTEAYERLVNEIESAKTNGAADENAAKEAVEAAA